MNLLLSIYLTLFSGPGDSTKAQDLTTVTVKSSIKKETISSVINLQRKSVTVLDVVSYESIKKTPDRTISDVLKRVGGASIQNDKFVVVRGLSDRYNSVMVNNILIGSTEPDRKAFSFDLIPSNSIDNLIVYKTSSSELPGDFSGGIIKITTKNSDTKIKSIDIGLSYGSLSTFNNSWKIRVDMLPKTFPTTKEFRALSFEKKQIESNKINGNYILNQTFNIPNTSLVYNFGKGDKKFSYFTNLTIRKSNNITKVQRREYMSEDDLMYNYNDLTYIQNLNIGSIANFRIKKIDIKNNINFLNENLITNRTGINYDNEQIITTSSSNHNQKLIIMSQVGLPKINIGYTLLRRNQPDYRVNPYAKNITSNKDSSYIWRDSYRFWSKMNEHTFTGTYNDTLKKLKYGLFEQYKFRNFDARVFRYQPNFVLDEITNNTDRYSAFSNLLSAYVLNNKIYNKFVTSYGIRIENQIFSVNTSDFSGKKVSIDRNYLDLLPSINLIYNKNSKTNIRFSLSKTVARPEFREVSNFSYYDFIRNAQIVGNEDLIRTKITNLDLRYEIFPSNKELITFSTFYKRFINPIEQIVDNGSVPSNLILTYSNPKLAIVYGGEIEIRKSINKFFNVYSNFSYFKSEVNVQGRVRPLQGQSPYVINGGIFYTKTNYSINILYNRIGERISSVGFQGYDDIYENSRDVIDLTFQYQKNKFSFKLSISDLLSQNSKFYQNNKDRVLINTNNEKTINLTINYKL
jgi:hypothetical protein